MSFKNVGIARKSDQFETWAKWKQDMNILDQNSLLGWHMMPMFEAPILT